MLGVVYAATFFLVAAFLFAALMGVGTFFGSFSLLGLGGAKAASASVRKSNSFSRGMATYPVRARRRAKLVSFLSGT
jgi:hypothetical protein